MFVQISDRPVLTIATLALSLSPPLFPPPSSLPPLPSLPPSLLPSRSQARSSKQAFRGRIRWGHESFALAPPSRPLAVTILNKSLRLYPEDLSILPSLRCAIRKQYLEKGGTARARSATIAARCRRHIHRPLAG